MNRAVIVVDLGFGDAGKGLTTDYYVRALGAHTVVRFNGGAQAGHNVVLPDGTHHTFSQFGSGTFVPGVHTLLSRDVVFHPTALRVESEHLARAGVDDALARLSVSEDALVTTPFQQALGRLREWSRGGGHHGSCGVGFGETVRDGLAGIALRVRDLSDVDATRGRLDAIREQKLTEARVFDLDASRSDVAAELRLLGDRAVGIAWLERACAVVRAVRVVTERDIGAIVLARGAIVFEGAQGVLLDEWHGFHPHTTWSTCTFDNALSLLRAHRYGDRVTRLGVLRTYAVRHGRGPMPTESPTLARALGEVHNGDDAWQGPFRVGWFDAVLGRYALRVVGGVDGLMLTHVDVLAKYTEWRLANAYEGGSDLEPVAGRDLARQSALTERLFASVPQWVTRAATEANYVDTVEALLGTRVALQSRGPTHRTVVGEP